MNLLNKTSAYTIGHMEYQNGEGWRQYVEKELTPLGINIYNPYAKPFCENVEENEDMGAHLKMLMETEQYDEVSKIMRRIRNFDLRLTDISTFCIAHIQPSIASWGSAEELTTVCRAKKAVFISVEGGKKKCPRWIMGMFPHKYIYDSVGDVVTMIKKIDSGEKPMDSDRWKLLKPEFR